jgi:ribonucleoside-diphosphate reductase alpha chain
MYLETRDIDEYMKIYIEAWKRGLKTTYYLHVKPRHQSEQTTVSVEKASANKIRTGGHTRGFGFARKK